MKRKQKCFYLLLPVLLGALIFDGLFFKEQVKADEGKWVVVSTEAEKGPVGSCMVEVREDTGRTRRTYVKPDFSSFRVGEWRILGLRAGNGSKPVIGVACGAHSLCRFDSVYSLVTCMERRPDGSENVLYRFAREVKKGKSFTQNEYNLIPDCLAAIGREDLEIVENGHEYAPGEDVVLTFTSMREVRIDPGNGTLPDGAETSYMVPYNTVLTLPVPTLSRHNFTGWYTPDGKRFDESQPVTESITLTAGWEAVTCNFVVYGNHRIADPTAVSQGGNYYLYGCHPGDTIRVIGNFDAPKDWYVEDVNGTYYNLGKCISFLGYGSSFSFTIPEDASGDGSIQVNMLDSSHYLIDNLTGWCNSIKRKSITVNS